MEPPDHAAFRKLSALFLNRRSKKRVPQSRQRYGRLSVIVSQIRVPIGSFHGCMNDVRTEVLLQRGHCRYSSLPLISDLINCTGCDWNHCILPVCSDGSGTQPMPYSVLHCRISQAFTDLTTFDVRRTTQFATLQDRPVRNADP